MYLQNYRLQKAWLLKCLNRTLSEHLWKVNMLKGAKHCLNLHGSSFVIFFDHSERTSVWKNSILVVSEILRLFFNILTPSDEYSLSLKWVFHATNSNSFISKAENFCSISFCISESYIKFGTFWKKRWASYLMYFRNYRLQNVWLLNCLKSPVPE